ncbi:carotenoid oxygenase family protein [Myxosarcina sp. GI1(2024)]
MTTRQHSANYQLGLTSLEREVENEPLSIQGKLLPSWLNGSLIRTGPAKFEVGANSYRHLLDGLAMLHRFDFEGEVIYTNKFLSSQAYQQAKATGKISKTEFGTFRDRSFLGRLFDFFSDSQATDNANVNIAQLGDRLVSLTETPSPVIFEPKTLATVGKLDYEPKLPGQITTAHPHFDFERDRIYNYQTHFARHSSYQVYYLEANKVSQHLLCTVSAREPAYMHSFAMTDNYLILAEFPLVANPLNLATSDLRGKSFIENYHWKPQLGTCFSIISKNDGTIVNTYISEPFFAFHHVNAFERDNEIVLDINAYPDAAIVEKLYLKNLATGKTDFGKSNLRRYYLPLNGSAANFEILSTETVEFPRINYKQCNGKNYRFVYGGNSSQPDNFIDRLVKVDVEQRATKFWQETDCYPGEPVFVAAPETSVEDAGVILSVVLDARKAKSFLLVLDASSFSEVARVHLPHHIPFSFHGQYFADDQKSTFNSNLHR